MRGSALNMLTVLDICFHTYQLISMILHSRTVQGPLLKRRLLMLSCPGVGGSGGSGLLRCCHVKVESCSCVVCCSCSHTGSGVLTVAPTDVQELLPLVLGDSRLMQCLHWLLHCSSHTSWSVIAPTRPTQRAMQCMLPSLARHNTQASVVG